MRVPERTGKYCPACGASMVPEAPAAQVPAMAPPAPPPAGRFEMEAVDAPMALPMAVAAGGALIGALIWAGVAYVTGWEIGLLAWLIGGLVGGGCVVAGGRGTVHAAAAAALALVGIVGGRLLATDMLVGHGMDQLTAMLTPAAFESMREQAAEFADMPAAPLAEMLTEGDEQPLTEEETQQMLAAQQHMVTRLSDPDYTFERWRDEQIAIVQAQVSIVDIVVENLDPIDILFLLLGLSTAFGVVSRASVRPST